MYIVKAIRSKTGMGTLSNEDLEKRGETAKDQLYI